MHRTRQTHAESYYDKDFENLVMDMLLRPVRTHLAWSERADQAPELLRPIVRDHLGESVRQLRALADQHTIMGDSPHYLQKVDDLLNRWEMKRADMFADRIIQLGSNDSRSVLAIAPSGSHKTVAEMQRELHRLMQPSDAELNRLIAEQRSQVEAMRKKCLQPESAERVSALVQK